MLVQRTSVRGLVLAVLVLAFAAPVNATTSIGLYTDSNGSSCSFSGNQSGIVNVYVVLKPDNLGISGVRFSAPIPACFGGTWLADFKPDESLTIGESPTGISVAFTSCAADPRLALQIQYMRTSTTPCCPFAIAPDPFVGIIEGTTCSLAEASMLPVTSHFNSDSSCPCTDPAPPHAVTDPSPANNAIFVSRTAVLSWTPSPLDGDIASYDVYLGTTTPPPFVATVTSASYPPAQPMEEDKLHYWKVVVRDNDGNTASSPIWQFTTRLGNYPPNVPSTPSPADNAINQNTTVQLSWTSGDMDNEALVYDLYLGTGSPPPLVATDLPYSFFNPSGLELAKQYHWRVVARDPHGAETSGPEWVFATRGSNLPPLVPSSPFPAAGSSTVSVNATLTWQDSDPDGDALKFDVYLGTTNPPPLVSENQATKVYAPVSPLAFSAPHYWKIVARDPLGYETGGPLWTFTTAANQPPTTPSSPNPANNATGIWSNPTLYWTSTDEYPGLKFDVYFGTTNPPPLVASNYGGTSYSLGALTASATYRWQIVARDVQGLTRTGPVWTFFTAAAPAPFGPLPANAGFGAAPLTLSWSCSKPNGQTPACDVYFGTTNPPPLVASNLAPVIGTTGFAYAPAGNVTLGAIYYWSIYAHDTLLGAMGPVWSYTGARRGDVNNDGVLTVDDASCALKVAVGNTTCAVPGGSNLADVNCDVGVTPRDALCIHRRAIGQTCPFCGESATSGTTLAPIVTRSQYWQDGNTLHAVLAVQSVPALEAFSFVVRTPTNAPLTSAIRRGATGNFTALEIQTTNVQSQVGMYSLTSGNATFATDFIELTFTVSGSLTGYIVAENFTDDLAGAAQVSIIAGNGKGGGGETPVTFSHFEATLTDDGVRIAWLLHFIAATESYTLFRHEDGRSPIAITTGDIHTEAGSYVDRTVEAGKKYRYEMLVHTVEGDDQRSPLVSVSVPAQSLALGPNHPNPFNPLTTIPYYVPAGTSPVRVRLIIYDTSGRSVRVLVDENQPGGARDVVWRGDDETGATVSSGIYFCVLQVGNERRTQKLVMLK